MAPMSIEKRHEGRKGGVERPLTDYEKWRLYHQPDYMLSDDPKYDFFDEDFAETQQSVDSDLLDPFKTSKEQHSSTETNPFDYYDPGQLVEDYDNTDIIELKYMETVSPQHHGTRDFSGFSGMRSLVAVIFVVLLLAAKASTRTRNARLGKDGRA
jgi:hypothetical protein